MSLSTVIQAPVFSGHESFPIRFTWLAKAVQHCERADNRDLFSRADAMVHLGVGKNMVRSIRSWAVTTGMLEPEDTATRATSSLMPSKIGAYIFGKRGVDPFMEDPATVWLIHWFIASNPRLATWHWTFNTLRETEFERQHLIRQLHKAARTMVDREIAEDTITRDVDCLLRTYVPSEPDKRLSREELLDCPLTELHLIRRSGTPSGYTFVRGRHDSLPHEVFTFCLLSYWNHKASQAQSIAFDDIAYGVGSPGQVLKLTENAIVDRLHELERVTRKGLRFDDTAGLRQVFRSQQVDAFGLLRRHYE